MGRSSIACEHFCFRKGQRRAGRRSGDLHRDRFSDARYRRFERMLGRLLAGTRLLKRLVLVFFVNREFGRLVLMNKDVFMLVRLRLVMSMVVLVMLRLVV